jgi:hypothetical protein
VSLRRRGGRLGEDPPPLPEGRVGRVTGRHLGKVRGRVHRPRLDRREEPLALLRGRTPRVVLVGQGCRMRREGHHRSGALGIGGGQQQRQPPADVAAQERGTCSADRVKDEDGRRPSCPRTSGRPDRGRTGQRPAGRAGSAARTTRACVRTVRTAGAPRPAPGGLATRAGRPGLAPPVLGPDRPRCVRPHDGRTEQAAQSASPESTAATPPSLALRHHPAQGRRSARAMTLRGGQNARPVPSGPSGQTRGQGGAPAAASRRLTVSAVGAGGEEERP